MNELRDKTPLVAANWKLNKNPEETREFVEKFADLIKRRVPRTRFIVFPPALNITTFVYSANSYQVPLAWGAQNIHSEVSGAFTGENSAKVVKQLGGSFALIGHSERRHVFGEQDELLANKVKLAQELGLVPMFCVGETLEQREAGHSKEVVLEQLKTGLAMLDVAKPLVIAYEPVWAIGTGKVAKPEDAGAMHAEIRTYLKANFNAELPEVTPILYGGSVKPENAKELWAQADIDGFLVGGASLDPESFADIYSNCL